MDKQSGENTKRTPGIKDNLRMAQERLKQANDALVAKHTGGEWDEYRSAYQALLVEERVIAAEHGEEYAEPFGFPVQWNTGAPLPHLLVSDGKTFLIFLVDEIDPAWDGTYTTIKSPANGQVEPLALVEFIRCASTKFGAPNDEVLSDHPLDGKGLEPYTAQVVRNSRWLTELERVNSVHSQYNPAVWQKLNHYVFWFHDTTFECVAESFNVELFNESFSEVLARTCQRLIS